MRKVLSGLFMSLDGVTEAPNEWQFDSFDEDLGAEMGAMIGDTDTILLGRVTYQEWADYWPTSTDEPFASFINNTPKYVASTTLDSVDWQNSTLIKGDLAATIARLKAEPGKTITVTGSPTLVRSLLTQGLLDELLLMIHPVVAGKGKRLFAEGDLQRMELVGHKVTSAGVAVLTYHPK
ncbi:MAG TPA: dihydrofolate reductase family protein [Chloroflexia bacterium]|nr:dihydrofolate reductase family protein [Chloroflexia bacterium]